MSELTRWQPVMTRWNPFKELEEIEKRLSILVVNVELEEVVRQRTEWTECFA